MTQRNKFPQILQATHTGAPDSLRVAFGLAPDSLRVALVLVLITLITVQLGAGFGYV